MKTNSVIISRNVRFYENIFLYSNEDNDHIEPVLSDNFRNEENNVQPTTGKRRREHRQHAYLKDYQYALLQTWDVSEVEGHSSHPLSFILSYESSYKEHRAYSLALAIDTELKSYNLAVKDKKKWQEAMENKLQALRGNET